MTRAAVIFPSRSVSIAASFNTGRGVARGRVSVTWPYHLPVRFRVGAAGGAAFGGPCTASLGGDRRNRSVNATARTRSAAAPTPICNGSSRRERGSERECAPVDDREGRATGLGRGSAQRRHFSEATCVKPQWGHRVQPMGQKSLTAERKHRAGNRKSGIGNRLKTCGGPGFPASDSRFPSLSYNS